MPSWSAWRHFWGSAAPERSPMIEVFVSDIDGCLAVAYQPFDLDALRRLAERVADAGRPGNSRLVPSFSLCSGRAYAYVEAISQALGLRTPVLFESGGGMFDPVRAQVAWHPAYSEEVDRQMNEVRAWLKSSILPGTMLMYDYGKRTQAGVIGPRRAEVDAMYQRVERFLEATFPDLHALRTDVSIDVVAPGVTKYEGLVWLCEELNLSLEQIAYIGDTHGDIPALEAVGTSFAPSNASADVRAAVDVVTSGAVIEGVVEAYDACIERNRRAAG